MKSALLVGPSHWPLIASWEIVMERHLAGVRIKHLRSVGSSRRAQSVRVL